jgi:Raf kinase inhibitor-like YbhB/YbcL family protein
MRTAYALIGLGFVLIFVALYVLTGRVGNSSDISRTSGSIESAPETMSSILSLTSPEFTNNASIPPRYTCDGDQMSPPITISGVPENARSLALIMDDPDVPKALRPDGIYDHWILFNIPPAVTGIAAGSTVGTPGANSSGKNAYTGPCPPPQYEPSTHRYVFTLYALDAELSLAVGASKAQVLSAMQGHILAQTQLVGKYKRQ